MSVLVRDWSDLSRIRASAIADAVMSTPPINLEQWLEPFRANAERVHALLAAEPTAALKVT